MKEHSWGASLFQLATACVKGRPYFLGHTGEGRFGGVVTEGFHDYLVSLKGRLPGVLFFESREPEGSSQHE